MAFSEVLGTKHKVVNWVGGEAKNANQVSITLLGAKFYTPHPPTPPPLIIPFVVVVVVVVVILSLLVIAMFNCFSYCYFYYFLFTTMFLNFSIFVEQFVHLVLAALAQEQRSLLQSL